MSGNENTEERTVELISSVIKKWREETNKKDTKVHVSEIHLKALDDLVNVNSLFTVAVFVGLSMANRGQLVGLDARAKCQAGPEFGKLLVVYEVIAFACFLLSSLVAKVIKLHLYLDKTSLGVLGHKYTFVRKNFDMKDFMLILTACSSITGILLLTISIVNVIQIRIGLLSCGIPESWVAALALCVIVGVALVIYVVTMAIAIYASIESDDMPEKVEKVEENGRLSENQLENMPVMVGLQTGVSGVVSS